jgi:hypothetical protein
VRAAELWTVCYLLERYQLDKRLLIAGYNDFFAVFNRLNQVEQAAGRFSNIDVIGHNMPPFQ